MNNNFIVNDSDYKKKIIKYLLFSLIIYISILYIPANKINNTDIITISAISSISYAIIDMISPSVVYQDK